MNLPSMSIRRRSILSHEGTECIVMEHVAGKPLSGAIVGKEMRLSEVLKCATQIADALAAAHSARDRIELGERPSP